MDEKTLVNDALNNPPPSDVLPPVADAPTATPHLSTAESGAQPGEGKAAQPEPATPAAAVDKIPDAEQPAPVEEVAQVDPFAFANPLDGLLEYSHFQPGPRGVLEIRATLGKQLKIAPIQITPDELNKERADGTDGQLEKTARNVIRAQYIGRLYGPVVAALEAAKAKYGEPSPDEPIQKLIDSLNK